MANNVLVLLERLKKKVDSEICIFTKSGGSGLVSLGDFALFKFCQVFLLDHEYSPCSRNATVLICHFLFATEVGGNPRWKQLGR